MSEHVPSPVNGESFELIDACDVKEELSEPNGLDFDGMARAPTPVDAQPPKLARATTRFDNGARISSPPKDEHSVVKKEHEHSKKDSQKDSDGDSDGDSDDDGDKRSKESSNTSSPKATGATLAEASEESEDDRIVQVAFALDVTGSMSPWITAAKETILNTAKRLQEKCDAKVEFGAVVYRDIPPQDNTFVVRRCPFTTDLQAFRNFVQRQEAGGGGDGPEAVASALHEARLLNWKQSTKSHTSSNVDRNDGVVESVADVIEPNIYNDAVSLTECGAKNVTRILLFITDAPPHGIGVSGDGFPQGEPIWQAKAGQLVGYDPFVEMKALGALEITTHFVFAESGSYGKCPLTRSFYNTMASMSQGRAVRLGDASDLIELVSSSAVEARQMDDLAQEVTTLMAQLYKETPEMPAEEAREFAFRSLSETARPVVTQIECSELDDESCALFRSCASLEEMRGKASSVKPKGEDSYGHRSLYVESGGYHSMTDPLTAVRSWHAPLGCDGARPPASYRSLSAVVDRDDPCDEDDEPVYRSTGAHGSPVGTKRALEAKLAPLAPPPSPAMRVRSYDAKMTDDQLRNLIARVA